MPGLLWWWWGHEPPSKKLIDFFYCRVDLVPAAASLGGKGVALCVLVPRPLRFRLLPPLLLPRLLLPRVLTRLNGRVIATWLSLTRWGGGWYFAYPARTFFTRVLAIRLFPRHLVSVRGSLELLGKAINIQTLPPCRTIH